VTGAQIAMMVKIHPCPPVWLDGMIELTSLLCL